MIHYTFLRSLQYNVGESTESLNREMLISIGRSLDIKELVFLVHSTVNSQSSNVNLDDLQ